LSSSVTQENPRAGSRIDLAILIAIAAAVTLLHLVTNTRSS
jgi:hypothetical protein